MFLSIGYSTCHWCHVMERESFEDLDIARQLNDHYIAIKVDREVHSDIDQVYMTAAELLTGGGGWPLSSILTPEGETIAAGTYFPPAEFADLLQRAQALWRQRPEDLRAQARQVASAVARALAAESQAAELGECGHRPGRGGPLGPPRRTAGRIRSASPSFPRSPGLASCSIRPCARTIARRSMPRFQPQGHSPRGHS